MVQGEGNIGHSGYAEPYAVHEQLATGRERPSQEHQPDRAENTNDDRDIQTSWNYEHGGCCYPTTRFNSRLGT